MKAELVFTEMDDPALEGRRLTVHQVDTWNLRTPGGPGAGLAAGRGELHLSISGSQALWNEA